MLTKRTAITKAKIFLTECRGLPFTIEKAIVFGSAVNGSSQNNSDIDIALFAKSFNENIFYNLDLIGAVNIRFPEIDVHAYPLEYYKKKSLLIDEIKRTGIEIY